MVSPNDWTATLSRGNLKIRGLVAPELRKAAPPHGWSFALTETPAHSRLLAMPATNVSSYGARIVMVPLWMPIIVLACSIVLRWRRDRSNNDTRLHPLLQRSLMLAGGV